MSEKRKNDTIIEGEYYDPDLPAQENTPPQKHRRTRSAGNVPKYNPASESIITKSNDLIQKTKYALPKLEQKVLLAMMAQINPKETPDANRVYSLSFSDFGRLAGVNMHDNTYLEYLKDTVKSLEDRSFWSLDPASDGHQYKVLSWLQRGSTVNDRDKQIRVRFNPEILPYLSQLKSNYTSYNVEYLLTMNSTYSMRFYEILLSYDNGDTDYGYTNGLVFQPVTKEILDRFPDKAQDIRGFKYKVFDIQELKEQLSPPPEKRKKDKEKPLTEKYSNFHDFERYVLTKARDEINPTSGLTISRSASAAAENTRGCTCSSATNPRRRWTQCASCTRRKALAMRKSRAAEGRGKPPSRNEVRQLCPWQSRWGTSCLL